MANSLDVILAGAFEMFAARSGARRGRLSHHVAVAHGRKILVPTELDVKVHAELARKLSCRFDFMEVVTEGDELPKQPRFGNAMVFLEGVDPFDVGDHPVEISPHPVPRI